MKIKRPSICMKIKGISNLIHQELGTNRDTVNPGTMMQKMFLGYLEVHEDQPVFQKDLESAFHIRRSTATGILQIMVRDGLIVREPVEDDARLKRLVLTPIAIEQLAQMQQDILRVEQKATAGLTGEELKALYVLLDKVIENLTPGKEERTID